MSDRPKVLYRVEFMEGFGFPECDRQERTKRTYENARDATAMVAEIKRHPDHHRLLGVYKCSPHWEKVTDTIERLADLTVENENRAEVAS